MLFERLIELSSTRDQNKMRPVVFIVKLALLSAQLPSFRFALIRSRHTKVGKKWQKLPAMCNRQKSTFFTQMCHTLHEQNRKVTTSSSYYNTLSSQINRATLLCSFNSNMALYKHDDDDDDYYYYYYYCYTKRRRRKSHCALCLFVRLQVPTDPYLSLTQEQRARRPKIDLKVLHVTSNFRTGFEVKGHITIKKCATTNKLLGLLNGI